MYTGSCAKCFRILWLLGSLGDFVAQNKVIGSVNRSSVLKHVLHGILLAAHPILWCLVLLLLSTTLFAIVGVRLAGGKLDSCTDLYTTSAIRPLQHTVMVDLVVEQCTGIDAPQESVCHLHGHGWDIDISGCPIPEVRNEDGS